MDEKSLHKLEPFWNSWYVDGVIGEGSYGSVYRIVREEFGQKYFSALKIISTPKNQNELKQVMMEGMTEEEAKEYFKEKAEEIYGEINLMAKLKGKSSIVSYEDHQVVERTGNEIGYDILIRMELLKGLNDYVVRSDMDVTEVVRMGREICQGLVLCQKHGIMHRDIKPDNIFVSADGEFKLGDFGIAKKMESLEHGFTIRGTYEYMAPEVYHGEKYDARVDIYSLGIVLYMFLNRKKTPFIPTDKAKADHATRQMALKRRFSGEKIEAPVQAGARLSLVILKAVAYEPEDRYQTAEEFYDALMSLTEGECLEYAGTAEEKQKQMEAILSGKEPAASPRQEETGGEKTEETKQTKEIEQTKEISQTEETKQTKEKEAEKEEKQAAKPQDTLKEKQAAATAFASDKKTEKPSKEEKNSSVKTADRAKTGNSDAKKAEQATVAASGQPGDTKNQTPVDATEFQELDRTVRLSPRETLLGNRQETQTPEVDELASLRTIPQQSRKNRTMVIAVVGILAVVMIVAIVLLQSADTQTDPDGSLGDTVASVQTPEPEKKQEPSEKPKATKKPQKTEPEATKKPQKTEPEATPEPTEEPEKTPEPIEEYPSANSMGLKKISELEAYEYVLSLNIMNNRISDLKPLKKCIYLEELNASHNKIRAVTALEGVTTLKKLDLGSNKIKDISSLQALTGLTVLKLSDNELKDISVIAALTELEELDLSYNPQIKDISALLKLKKLKNVYLLGNDKIDKKQLGKLEKIVERNGGMLLVE